MNCVISYRCLKKLGKFFQRAGVFEQFGTIFLRTYTPSNILPAIPPAVLRLNKLTKSPENHILPLGSLGLLGITEILINELIIN
jgi:hypothetical protein